MMYVSFLKHGMRRGGEMSFSQIIPIIYAAILSDLFSLTTGLFSEVRISGVQRQMTVNFGKSYKTSKTYFSRHFHGF